MKKHNMKDRYLFRGKRIDSGEWVEGNIIDEIQTYIRQRRGFQVRYPQRRNRSECRVEMYVFEVDPATVGQCTGVRDKNGTLIFEGDILFDGIDSYIVGYSEVETGFNAAYMTSIAAPWSLFHLAHKGNRGREIRINGDIYDISNNPELPF